MDNLAQKAYNELQSMEHQGARDSLLHRLHPISKLLITVTFLWVTVSFHKYNLSGLVTMALFPILGYQLGRIPVSDCFVRMRYVLPLVMAVGLFNPWFDREVLMTLGTVSVSGGVISMLTLMLKGVFCLMMSYLFAATTRIEELCRALYRMHCPQMLVSLFLLCYRHLGLMLEEVSTMTTAYSLRAPMQKGIGWKAWGSFLGQLILRSSDRSKALYEAMLLRGYYGEMPQMFQTKVSGKDIIFPVMCIVLFFVVRYVNVAAVVGSLFLG